MIFNSDEFVFKAQMPISRARRVLVAPCIDSKNRPYPYSTSPKLLNDIIEGIRHTSDADVLIIAGTGDGGPVHPVYKELGYDFPRVIMLDAKDSTWVEVDNPLEKPLAMPTFLMPNVVLSSDYLITTCPLKTTQGEGELSIYNLLSLLSVERYGQNWEGLNEFGMENVIADLYFTMPFDMGIVEGTQILEINANCKDVVKPHGKIYQGEPYYIDGEVSGIVGFETAYLDLIDEAESDLDGPD